MDRRITAFLIATLALDLTFAAPFEENVADCIKRPGFFYCSPEVDLDTAVISGRKGQCCERTQLVNYS